MDVIVIASARQRAPGWRQQFGDDIAMLAGSYLRQVASAALADDFELVRPHLRTVDLVQDSVLVACADPGDSLSQAREFNRPV
jgi:hypothetical protein